MNDPAYFEYGDDVSPGVVSRAVQVFVLAVFLITTVGAGLVDTIWPIEPVKPIGAELQRQEALAARANLWDGSLARLFEKDLRARSFVRDLVLPRYSLLKFSLLNEGPAGVTVGKDHWAFYRSRIRMSAFPSEVLAGGLVNSMVAIDRRVNGNGTQLHLLPIPRKSYVAREYLPDGVEARHEVDDLVLDGLIARGVNVADLRGPYAEAGAPAVYFKLDSHWTPDGAEIAAKELAQIAGLLSAPERRLGKLKSMRLRLIGGMGTGTLGSIGREIGPSDARKLGLDPVRQVQLRMPRWANKLVARRVPGKYALAGTSFSYDWRLTPLLSHYVGYPVYNGSLSARPYMDSLSNVLNTYAHNENAQDLEHLFWETPIGPPLINHNSGALVFGKPIGAAFAAATPQHSESVVEFPSTWVGFPIGEPVRISSGEGMRIAKIPRAFLAQSGDGAAGLAIAGEIGGGSVHILSTCGQVKYSTQLAGGPFDLVLPVLSAKANAEPVEFVVSGAGGTTIRFDRQELVHEFVEGTRVPLASASAQEGVQLTPEMGSFVGRRAALVLQLKSKEPSMRNVTVRVLSKNNSANREFTFPRLGTGCSLILDLGLPPGTELDAIELNSESGPISVHNAHLTGMRL